MTVSDKRRGRAAWWITALLLGVAYPSPVHAANDLSAMLKVVPADGAATLVVDDLAAMETALTAWRPLLGATGFGAESIAALRKLLPFAEWVNVSAPLAFRPPAVGTADKAVYWLHIPQFKEKIAALPTASEDDGMWCATDRAGVTWFARASGDVVILSASRIHVESASTPARTLAEEYEGHKDIFAARNLLLHMQSAAYAAQLGAALESLSGGLSAPAADGRVNPLSALTAQTVRDLRVLTEQTRSVGLLLHVDVDKLAASFVLSFRDGSVREYLENVRDGEGCVNKLALGSDDVFAAAWCEPGTAAPFLGPWLNRRIDALDSPLKKVLADLRSGTMSLAPDEAFFRATISLSGSGVTTARESIDRANSSADGVHRLLHAFRGSAPDPAADLWHENLVPLFSPAATLAVKAADQTLTLSLGSPRPADAAPQTRPEEIPRLRTALGQLDRQTQLIILVDPAGLLPALARFGLTAAPLNTLPPGPLASMGVTAKPAGIRIDVHIPKVSLERIQEATTPSGPT